MSETKITPFMKEFAKFFETQGVIINFVDFEGKPIKQEENDDRYETEQKNASLGNAKDSSDANGSNSRKSNSNE